MTALLFGGAPWQLLDPATGQLAENFTVEFFEPGGAVTGKNVFTTAAGDTAIGTTVTIGSDGFPDVAGKAIFMVGKYYVRIKNVAGTVIWQDDNITGWPDLSNFGWVTSDWVLSSITFSAGLLSFDVDGDVTEATGDSTAAIARWMKNSGTGWSDAYGAIATAVFGTPNAGKTRITARIQAGVTPDDTMDTVLLGPTVDQSIDHSHVSYPVHDGEIVSSAVVVTKVKHHWGEGRRFGAVGDWNGTTGTDNSSALQDWLDSKYLDTFDHSTDYRGPLELWHGNYAFNTALTRTGADGLHIRGKGNTSWLTWTGADDAVMLFLTGAGSGDIRVEDIIFNLNSKASTGLKIDDAGHFITVQGCQFWKGKQDAGNTLAMLEILAECHNNTIIRNWFFDSDARAINMNIANASGGHQGNNISINSFQQIRNFLFVGFNMNGASVWGNEVTGLITAEGYGFDFDRATHIGFRDNFIEGQKYAALRLNPTTRSTSKAITAVVDNNFFNTNAPADHDVEVGLTDMCIISNNSAIGHAGKFLNIAAGAKNTVIGMNTHYADATGTTEAYTEEVVTDAGTGTSYRYSKVEAKPSAAIVSATSQSDDTAFTTLSTISTTQSPNISPDARAYKIRVEYNCATVGGRFYVCKTGAVTWANRDTDPECMRFDAVVSDELTVQEFIVHVDMSFEDRFDYAVDRGAGDHDYKITIIEYYLPG